MDESRINYISNILSVIWQKEKYLMINFFIYFVTSTLSLLYLYYFKTFMLKVYWRL